MKQSHKTLLLWVVLIVMFLTIWQFLSPPDRKYSAFSDFVNEVHSGRVDEIKQHHDERLDELLRISDELGWATVVELSQRLFAERSWGSMAEDETYAHLEHLRLSGRAERREENGVLSYRT